MQNQGLTWAAKKMHLQQLNQAQVVQKKQDASNVKVFNVAIV
jgi:hypothetical protein